MPRSQSSHDFDDSIKCFRFGDMKAIIPLFCKFYTIWPETSEKNEKLSDLKKKMA